MAAEEQNEEINTLPYDIYYDLIPRSDDDDDDARFTFLFNADDEFMLPSRYYELWPYRLFRRFSLSSMESINNHSGNLDAFIPYLAMTYIDRILSSSYIPDVCGFRPRNAHLFFVSCFTIASKMRNENFRIATVLEAPPTLNAFSTITRDEVLEMELGICERLEWKMRSITPFCFVDFFIDLLHRNSSVHAIIARRKVHQIIIKSLGAMQLIKYKPAVVAVAAVLWAATRLYRENLVELVNIVLRTGRIDGELLEEVIDNLKKVYLLPCRREPIADDEADLGQNGPMRFGLDWKELGWDTLDQEESFPVDIVETTIGACCFDFTC